jgi:oxygen-independent coproporphyrinogen-3 oxidase
VATSSPGKGKAVPFGVYIHFPYCSQRCPYCDFAIAVRRTVRHERYLDAVLAELEEKAPLYAGRRAVSVYFGGGTPSLWRPDCVARALDEVLARFPPEPGVHPEVTLECDPAGLAAPTLAELRAAGVNRLSIGAQSFDRGHLRVLGRRHVPDDIESLVRAARQEGFANLSLDLMIGLIGQKRGELDADLRKLIALGPEHVSLYQLTIEPRTPLAARIRRKEMPAPVEEFQAEAYDRVREVLKDAGYRHYEISSFARTAEARKKESGAFDYRSRHNQLYWTGAEYLGLGVGAHSFLRTFPPGSTAGYGERFANQRGIDNYLSLWAPPDGAAPPRFFLQESAPGLALYERLEEDALRREAVWLLLRRIEGFSLSRFAAEYGVDPRTEYASVIAALVEKGLLEVAGDVLRLSQRGVLFADEVGASFL